jgi:hypothetical protein
MADDYPKDLLAYAVPPANSNRAGIKSPSMNAIPDQVISRKQPGKAKAAPPPKPPRKPTPLESIKNQGKTAGIKFGTKPLWMPEDDSVDAAVQPAIPPDNGFDPFSVEPQAVPDAVVESQSRLPSFIPAMAAGLYSNANDYLNRKARLVMETQDGQFSLPVTDFKRSKYSVLVLVPLRDDSSIFIPKLGSRLTLTFKDTVVKVCYPGAYVEIDELKTGFMTFIIDEHNDEVK